MLTLESYISWQEVIEVLVFATGFFFICRTLEHRGYPHALRDLGYYTLICFIAYLLNLPALSSILIASAPGALILYALSTQQEPVIHSSWNTALSETEKQNEQVWPTDLISSIMTALNHNTDIYCIIEGTQSAHPYAYSEIPLQTPCSKKLLDTLLSSRGYDHTQMLWINSKGILIGINSTWRKTLQTKNLYAQQIQQASNISSTISNTIAWQAQATRISSTYNALFLHADASSRLFTLIADGTAIPQITAQKALELIRRRLRAQAPNNTKPHAPNHISDHISGPISRHILQNGDSYETSDKHTTFTENTKPTETKCQDNYQ